MADNPIIQPGVGKINEAVCIDTKRIYDSCVSKDCLENLRVTFFASSQRLIDEASSVKCRSCKISAVSIDVDEVPFNKGFYSADVHFYFMLQFDCYVPLRKLPADIPILIKSVSSTAQRVM